MNEHELRKNLHAPPVGLRPGLSLERQHIMAASEQLLEAVKLAYRKHHLGDESVGWDELSEALCDALCEAMGDRAFMEWIDEVKR